MVKMIFFEKLKIVFFVPRYTLSSPENHFSKTLWVFPLVLIIAQPKKCGNWWKFHAIANQIPESAEILIFSKKILALRARSAADTFLELSFRVFPLVLIIAQQTNFVRNFVWIWYFEVSVTKNPGINTQSFGRTKTNSLRKTLVLKTRNFGFQKHEVSVQKPEFSVRNPEV
jgi:hypothetical protein